MHTDTEGRGLKIAAVLFACCILDWVVTSLPLEANCALDPKCRPSGAYWRCKAFLQALTLDVLKIRCYASLPCHCLCKRMCEAIPPTQLLFVLSMLLRSQVYLP